jgi:hypothetical protein
LARLSFRYPLPHPARRRSFTRQDLMTNLPPTLSGPSSNDLPSTLIDRVAARVIDARLAIERRAGATRPKARRARPATLSIPSTDSKTAGELRETQSLRRVFRDLGVSYRRYRSQTGGPVTPGLRDAAYKFRAEPTLASLVAVAAYLDELDLLS